MTVLSWRTWSFHDINILFESRNFALFTSPYKELETTKCSLEEFFKRFLSNFFLSLFEKVYHSIFPPTWTQSAENGHDMSFNFFVCSFVRLLIFFVCPFIQFLCLSICSFFVAFYYFLLLFVFSHPSSTTIPFRELMGKLVKRGFLDSSPTDKSKRQLVNFFE